MRNKKTVFITFAALIMAIIIIMALVPQFGYIQIGLTAVTIIHIPVLIGSLTFKNWKLAALSGATFGVSSWFVAMTRPSTPSDLLFQNPLVSIFPRILFALIALLLFKILLKAFKERITIAALLSAVIATFLHTVMVLGMMYLLGKELFPNGFVAVIMGVVTVNGWIEIVLAGVIVPPIVRVLSKAFSHVELND
ncbi:MAG: ECF transporter S component [Bacilli bacterium]|nr:ECF transporter S component [Bacilli bacterium]